MMSLSGAPDELGAANFRQGILLIRLLRRLSNLPRPETRHSVSLTHRVAVRAVKNGTVRLMAYPESFEAKEAGGQAQPSGTGVMQDIIACSAAYAKLGTIGLGQGLRRCLGLPASPMPYCTSQGSELPWLVLGKCEQSEQGAGRGERTEICTLSYPETVSTPSAILF